MENMQTNKIMLELTTVFESSHTADELILGLKQVFKNYGKIKAADIFVYDKITNRLKNFTKLWENMQNTEIADELNTQYENFKKEGMEFINTEQNFYLPLLHKGKISGVIRIDGNIENEAVIQAAPLISRQISLAALNLRYFEKAKNNAKFYETIKNITKITETQYDTSYILPIIGEMIDSFIREHLIYIFLKNKNKKEYKLVWPNKCLIQNINTYLEEIKTSEPVIKNEGKTCIFPLMNENKPQGAIVAHNPIDILHEGEIEYLEQIAIQASVTISKAKEYMKTLEHATLDALTGLNNRHMFAKRLEEETSNARRQKTELCCIMTDIDFFKSVNDTYGHAIGDLVLKNVAKTIKKELREYDIASRYGGEEFAIILPNTPVKEAYKVAERLRSKIEKKKINISDYKIKDTNEISVTISIGVAGFEPDKMKESSMLYQKADKGLYIAKESGRNRVVVL